MTRCSTLGLIALTACATSNPPPDLAAVATARLAAPQEPSQQPAAQSSDASNQELALKLANPIASLISVPFQLNFDRGFGAGDDGKRWQLNIQPVVPIEISEDWNLISRTILPVLFTDDLSPGAGSEFGLGDTVQSAFFSPKEPTSGGTIWGVGPVILLPTATARRLGTEQLGLGPTGVALQQDGPWTYGGLANHIWSVAGDSSRPHVNATFVQPFAAYTTPDAWTFTVNSESTFDWRTDDWSIPINGVVSKLTTVGDTKASIGGGLRYWVDAPSSGPEGIGARILFTLLF